LSQKDIAIYDNEFKREYTEGVGCEPEIEAERFFEDAKTKQPDQESLRNIYIFKHILTTAKLLP